LFVAVSLLATLISVPVGKAQSPKNAEFPLQRETRIRFASVDEGRTALATADEFTKSLSIFDKQARIKTDDAVSDEAFLIFASSQVQAWTEKEVDLLQPIIADLHKRLGKHCDLFPEKVLLIKTTGREEANAAYTRGNAIIFPSKVLKRPAKGITRLLMHELFHVASRHRPKLRDRLYATIGFTPCGEFKWPESLASRKITNPDAPNSAHAITLKALDGTITGAPILYASVEKYDPKFEGDFFRFMIFRLILLERSPDGYRPRMKDGRPIVVDPKSLVDFTKQIGENTGYIIHPEEIIADNFVHLLQETPDLPTPRIVREMRRILAPPITQG